MFSCLSDPLVERENDADFVGSLYARRNYSPNKTNIPYVGPDGTNFTQVRRQDGVIEWSKTNIPFESGVYARGVNHGSEERIVGPAQAEVINGRHVIQYREKHAIKVERDEPQRQVFVVRRQYDICGHCGHAHHGDVHEHSHHGDVHEHSHHGNVHDSKGFSYSSHDVHTHHAGEMSFDTAPHIHHAPAPIHHVPELSHSRDGALPLVYAKYAGMR